MQKSLFKNALYKITLNFFNLLLPIIIGPYVFRALGKEAMGTVKYAETIFNYFFIFASFGIYQYGLREISRIKHDQKKVANLFTSLFTISIITNITFLMVFLSVSYFGFGDEIIFPLLLIFAINFILNIFYVEWMNEAFESYDFITIKTIAVKVVYVILLVSFIKGPDDYQWFAILLVISTLLNNIISFIYVKRKVKFDFKELTLLPHVKPLLLVVIFLNGNVLYTQLDLFMLGRFVSKESVSFYIMSQQMVMIISALMLSVVQVTIPRLSHLLGSQNEDEYLSLINRVAKVYFMLLFPAAIGMWIISDLAVIVYGGVEYAEAGSVLAIFAIYVITIGIDQILANQVIYAKRKEHVLVRFIIVGGLINLTLNSICIYMGIFSAEIAVMTTAISSVTLIIMEYIYIRKYLKVEFHLFSRSNMKYLAMALTFFPVSYVVKMFVAGTFTQFFVLIAVNGLVYLLLLILTKDEILHLLIGKIKQKLKR